MNVIIFTEFRGRKSFGLLFNDCVHCLSTRRSIHMHFDELNTIFIPMANEIIILNLFEKTIKYIFFLSPKIHFIGCCCKYLLSMNVERNRN